MGPKRSLREQEYFVSNPLIRALQDARLYDHPVEGFSVHETHISQVLLTGPYAYKIKKPLDFGFMNFSTLDSRRHFCEEEVRLNRRLAPELYIDVVKLTGSPEAPQINGDGDVFEYAVRMRQFDQSQLLDQVQERGELTAALIDDLALTLARFHQSAPAARPEDPLGTATEVHAPMAQNFQQIRQRLEDPVLLAQLDALEGWAQCTFERLEPLLSRRHDQGMVRECHGDLHLGNIALFQDKVTIFDCIEFNDAFRWIDVVNDLAFLLMDLDFRGLQGLSNRLLNGYLEQTGDFDALPLILFYKAYRAMVRAKIALLTLGSDDISEAERQVQMQKYRDYAQLAEDYTAIPNRFLLAMHGVSGSGKSRVSLELSQALGTVRFRSDVERKRLFGLGPNQSSHSQLDEGIYTREATEKTYARLSALATEALKAGFSVVVDAAFLRESEREEIDRIAEAQGVPFLLIHCHADEETLRERVSRRSKEGNNVSEAGLEILERQLQWQEPLAAWESSHTVKVDTTQGEPATALAERLRHHLLEPGLPT